MEQEAFDSTPTSPSNANTLREESLSTCSEHEGLCERNCSRDVEAEMEQHSFEALRSQRLLPIVRKLPTSYLAYLVDLLERDISHNIRYNSPTEMDFQVDFTEAVSSIIPGILGLTDCPAQQRDLRQRLFLAVCQREECFRALLCAAVLTGDLDKVEHLFPLMGQEKIRNALPYCTRKFASFGVWPARSRSGDLPPVWLSIAKLLTLRPECGSSQLAVQALNSFDKQPDTLYIYCMVLVMKAKPAISFLMKNLMMSVLFHGNCKQLDYVIEVDEENTGGMEKFRWLDVTTCYLMKHRDNVSTYNTFFTENLRKMLQVGLSTRRPLPKDHPECYFGLIRAIRYDDVDMLKLWYRSGVLSQPQMLRLCKKFKKVESATVRYIHSAATNPRRLQDLCVLTISPYIGYRSGKDRAARTQTLPLPNPLKNKILFKDIVADFFGSRETRPHT